ncbi:hypothetical protein ES703_19811 [subsurface metagenome]
MAEIKVLETLTCPTCGRGYPSGLWHKTKPKPWRLGVKQSPSLRMKVLGELRSPDELVDQGVFGVIRSNLLEAVANWVFRGWLDIRDVLNRVADLKRWGGRWVWHQQVDIPPVVHRVDHRFGWGVAPEGELPLVGHDYKIGRG